MRRWRVSVESVVSSWPRAVPNIKVSGIFGARAKRRPPNPQPMSAISTCFNGVLATTELSPSPPASDAVGAASEKSGKWTDQFMASGLMGLQSRISARGTLCQSRVVRTM